MSRTQSIFTKIRSAISQWYNGKDIPVYEDGDGSIGGLGTLPDYYRKERHWTAVIAKSTIMAITKIPDFSWKMVIFFASIATIIQGIPALFQIFPKINPNSLPECHSNGESSYKEESQKDNKIPECRNRKHDEPSKQKENAETHSI